MGSITMYNHNTNNNNNNNDNHDDHTYHHNNTYYPPPPKQATSSPYYAEYYQQPRRTALRHKQVHEPRHKWDKKRYQLRKYQIKGSKLNDNDTSSSPSKPTKVVVVNEYVPRESNHKNHRNHNHDRHSQHHRGGRRGNEWREKKHKKDRFSKHVTKEETDRILKDTKNLKSPVIYIGDISLSRFNPNVAYVRVDGIQRDVRVSGFLDRNRAFHGDRVVISLYPEIEWYPAIKPEVQQFEDRLNERDRLELEEKPIAEDPDDENINDIILDTHSNDDDNNNAASSSSSSSDDNDNKEDEEEIIYMSGSSADDKNSKKQKTEKTNSPKRKEKDEKIGVKNSLMFKRRKRDVGELKDDKSVLAYNKYLELRDYVHDFEQIVKKIPNFDLSDSNHPRRKYIDQVIQRFDNKLPKDALLEFKWDSPASHLNKISRGKVIGIYGRKKDNDMIPGFLLPMLSGYDGVINRKWALFTPLEKRYPKAWFPMRELPHDVKILFNKYEVEEIEIIKEWENRKYDAKQQGLTSFEIKKLITRRKNKYEKELRLIFLNMSFENKWPHNSFSPKCHLKELIGKRGKIDVETNVILSRHGITWRDKFDKEIENFVKDMKITEDDFVGRKDLRDLRVYSIDPTSARDFDDALSIELLEGEFDKNNKKLYKIGIHIADVTHFVKEGSVVDREAKSRATSVYLVDRCLPMLPHHLCQNLCSLNPDEDRLAYTVFVILNEEGHLVKRDNVSPWFGKSVIRSKARLNYETAHWMLVDKVTKNTPISELDECCTISSKTTLEEIIDDTKLFWSIAKKMRARRFEKGSVQFFRPHIRFRLDKENQHKSLKFGPEILLSSNHLIEEMMLLANQLVANQLISKIQSHTLLRRHPSPLRDKGKKLSLICRSQGLNLKYDTPNNLNKSLIEMQKKEYGGVDASKIINALLAQAMMRAEYIIVENSEPEKWRHWALNFPMYTHFTSPIRRYADVLVHRLLTYTLFSNDDEEKDEKKNDDDQEQDNDDENKARLPTIKQMKRQCERCNERNAAAHFAEIDSQTIHLCLLLIQRPIVVDVIIIDMFRRMFEIVIPGLGLNVTVHLDAVMRESHGQITGCCVLFELPDSTLVITWKSGKEEKYKLFDRIRVRLSSILKTPIKLNTAIIEPEKRSLVKVANSEAIKDEEAVLKEQQHQANECNDNDENDENKDNNANDNEDDILSPVAMTLDKQLKVGTSDFYAAHYD